MPAGLVCTPNKHERGAAAFGVPRDESGNNRTLALPTPFGVGLESEGLDSNQQLSSGAINPLRACFRQPHPP